MGFKKNTASQNLTFAMINASTGAAMTDITDANFKSASKKNIDNAGQAAITGTFTESGGGQYNLALSQADTNGNDIGFLIVYTGSIPLNLHLHTDNDAAYIQNIAWAMTGRKPWYVSKVGNDANDGMSPATAKLTIAAARALMGDGSRLFIDIGTWAESLDVHTLKAVEISGLGPAATILLQNTAASTISFGTDTYLHDLKAQNYKPFTGVEQAINGGDGASYMCDFSRIENVAAYCELDGGIRMWGQGIRAKNVYSTGSEDAFGIINTSPIPCYVENIYGVTFGWTACATIAVVLSGPIFAKNIIGEASDGAGAAGVVSAGIAMSSRVLLENFVGLGHATTSRVTAGLLALGDGGVARYGIATVDDESEGGIDLYDVCIGTPAGPGTPIIASVAYTSLHLTPNTNSAVGYMGLSLTADGKQTVKYDWTMDVSNKPTIGTSTFDPTSTTVKATDGSGNALPAKTDVTVLGTSALATATVASGIATQIGTAGSGLTALGDERLDHLDADVSSRTSGTLPTDYQQRGHAVTLPEMPPDGYGGGSADPSDVAAAVWAIGDIVDGFCPADAMRIVAAICAGLVYGPSTGNSQTKVFKGLDGRTDRVTIVADKNGDRTDVSYHV